MKRSPENFEKFIHETLRSVPLHRAPRTLEQRVFAAIDAKAALPWWKQSFVRWPMPARIAFLVLSAGLAKVALTLVVWVMAGFDSAQFTQAFSTQYEWIQTISAVVNSVTEICGAIYRSIPPLWLYGGLAFVGGMYLALFGLGAAAYRTLYTHR